MYPRDIRVDSPLEALVVEQALAMVREMKRAADAAPDGRVLDQAESIAVAQGRELTRKSLEAVLNDQAAEVEKEAASRTCSCGGARQHRGRYGRTVLTAAGSVKVRRVNFVCRKCGVGAHPLDERLGIEGSTSRQAQRVMCLAGASWSFDVAAQRLQELCGLSVSDNHIREICQRQAPAMAQWQREAPEASQAFRQAAGEIEFTTDGAMVNTWEGWREMRLGIFAKRRCGPPATAAEWSDRELPGCEARIAFAAIEKSNRFGTRWGRWVQRLGIRDTSRISVLADGARWIWEETSMHLAGATEVLDIYHALEHVGATSKVLYGEGTDAAQAWSDACGHDLLQAGWSGIRQRLEETKATVTRKMHRKSLKGLTSFLTNNQSRLGYPARLAEGRTIGSGQAEGACKHMIGRRLKQTGARWRVRGSTVWLRCAA